MAGEGPKQTEHFAFPDWENQVPSVEPAATETSEPTRVAFGGFVKPALYAIAGEHDLEAVTYRELAWVTPEQFASILFQPPRKADMVVDRIALNPYEFKLLARFPKRLAETAISNTLGDNDLTDDRMAAAQRSSQHVLEKKLPQMEEHAEKLRSARMDVRELKRRAGMPGYAHISPERMKQIIGVTWLEFTTILDVAHVQRNWSDDKRARAEAALVKYLTDGAQNQRVAHWQGMILLADNYLGARLNLFKERTKLIHSILDEPA